MKKKKEGWDLQILAVSVLPVHTTQSNSKTSQVEYHRSGSGGSWNCIQ